MTSTEHGKKALGQQWLFVVTKVVDPVFDNQIGWTWETGSDEHIVAIYEDPLDEDLLQACQKATGLNGQRDLHLDYIDDEHFIVAGQRNQPYLFGTYVDQDPA